MCIRDSYDVFPYGLHRTNTAVSFATNNIDGTRLYPEGMVLGIRIGETSKVYPISRLSQAISVINDWVGNMDVGGLGAQVTILL